MKRSGGEVWSLSATRLIRAKYNVGLIFKWDGPEKEGNFGKVGGSRTKRRVRS